MDLGTIILLIIAGGICYLAYQNRGKLSHFKIKQDRILDQWNVLIENAEGKEEFFAKSVERKAEKTAAPGIKLERKEISLGGLLLNGGSRNVIVATDKLLKGYRIFIGARDYGSQLSVSWYLTLKQSFLAKLSAAAAKSNAIALFAFPILFVARMLRLGKSLVVPEVMDIFEQEELASYAGTIHGFVKDATEEIMSGLNQDFSKVDTKTKGFISIS